MVIRGGALGRSPNCPLPKNLSGISKGDKLASAKGMGMGIEVICLTPWPFPLAVNVSDVALGCMPSGIVRSTAFGWLESLSARPTTALQFPATLNRSFSLVAARQQQMSQWLSISV